MAYVDAEREARTGSAAEVVEAGAVAGLIGGLLMGLLGMVRTAIAGTGFWMPLKLIAATFYGADALVGGAGVVILGLVVHVVVSMGLGVLFAALVSREMPWGTAIFAGVSYGVAILIGMTFIVLPVFDMVMLERIGMMPWTWFAMHVLFGVGVSAAPALRRAFADIEARHGGEVEG